MSLLGILNLRSAPSRPWQVSQLKVLNFLASKAWKIGFIVGVTATFMYDFFCAKVMSFQATSGGSDNFADGRTIRRGNREQRDGHDDEYGREVKAKMHEAFMPRPRPRYNGLRTPNHGPRVVPR